METKDNISSQVQGCFSSEILLKYLKGELTGAEMNSVEKHLEHCVMCQDELEGLSNMEDPERIVEIENYLNEKIDNISLEKKVIRFNPKNILRYAAAIAVLLGLSTIIYIVSVDNTLNRQLTDNKEMLEPKQADSLANAPSKGVGGVNYNKNKKSPTRSTKDQVNSSKEELKPEGDKIDDSYIAVVVADSVSNRGDILADEVVSADTISNFEVAEVMIAEKEEAKVEVSAVSSEAMGAISKRSRAAELPVAAAGNIAQEPSTVSREYQQNLAILYFNNGVYDKALKLFIDLLDKNPQSDTLNYYTAICHFHQNSYYESIDYLKKLTHKPQFAFYHESKWYLALAYIQLGRTKSADSLLHIIIKDSSPFKQKAKQELEKLTN